MKKFNWSRFTVNTLSRHYSNEKCILFFTYLFFPRRLVGNISHFHFHIAFYTVAYDWCNFFHSSLLLFSFMQKLKFSIDNYQWLIINSIIFKLIIIFRIMYISWWRPADVLILLFIKLSCFTHFVLRESLKNTHVTQITMSSYSDVQYTDHGPFQCFKRCFEGPNWPLKFLYRSPKISFCVKFV